MSYIDPSLQYRFESLPIELKNEILSQDVQLYTLEDLLTSLKNIADRAS